MAKQNGKAPDRAWLTPLEAAERAEVSTDTIGRWARVYRIGRKIGGRLRIDRAALDRLLAGEQPERAA